MAEETYFKRRAKLDELRSLDPIAFERFISQLFERMGYEVQSTSKTGDEGVDLILRKEGRSAIVQCKRYKGSVGQPVVRDLYGAMIHSRADEAYLITTGTISLPAQQWAADKPIHLVDGIELVRWVETFENLTEKLEDAEFGESTPEPSRKALAGCAAVLVACLLLSALVYRFAPERSIQAPTSAPMRVGVLRAEEYFTPELSTRTPTPVNLMLPTPVSVITTPEWTVKISSVKRARWLPWKGRKLEPDGQWLIVYGRIQNLTTKRITIFAKDFKLRTPPLKGEIDVHNDATGAAGDQSGIERTVAGFLGLNIKAGGSVPLVIAFDVPTGAERAILQVPDAQTTTELGLIEQFEWLPSLAFTASPEQ